MKYFFVSFLFLISLIISTELFAQDYSSGDSAAAACNAGYNSAAANPDSGASWGCTGSSNGTKFPNYVRTYYYLTGANTPQQKQHNFYYRYSVYGDEGCTNGSNSDGSCKPEGPQACEAAPNQPPDCLCSDGKPKVTGQYTTCDRPDLVYCEFHGRNVPKKDCPEFNLGDDCPTDAYLENGQCVNKCGVNAAWDAVLNACVDNQGNEQEPNVCPRGYRQNIDGVCVPDKCPPNKKLVNNTCVIDTDPKVSENTTTVTNPDGTTTITTVTTTTINNENGTTTTTTNTTVVTKDADGNTTGVDSKTEETEQKTEDKDEDDEKSEVSSGDGCISPPACSGDAIQCAQLHFAWKKSCETADDKVENQNQCDKEFKCEGSVLQCASLRASHLNFCESSSIALKGLISSSLPSGISDAGKTNADGSLVAAEGVEFNVFDQLGLNQIFSTQGDQGSCPSAHSLTLLGSPQSFDYELFICPMARKINPLVVFAAMIFSTILIYRAIEGL